ncbi:hypothetical protein Hdeb2414_s0018g00517741 [Helianthus debilis subsp. tardiflorus]
MGSVRTLVSYRVASLHMDDDLRIENENKMVACKMVGGGSDGTLDLFLRIYMKTYTFILMSSHNFLIQTTGTRA